MGVKTFFIAAMMVLLVPSVLAATIHGNVYDLSLNKVTGAFVEVNTTPAQVLVAKDGTYSIDIPKGTYLIAAKEKESGESIAIENRTITVLQDGSYVIDFILFPIIDDETSVDLDFSDVAGSENGTVIALTILAALFLLGIGAFIFLRGENRKDFGHEKDEGSGKAVAIEHKKEELIDDYLAQTLAIIKRQGGRATQKDIRKEIPLSEAKISLLISELEHKGKIEKIKKGRGNIVILKQ